MTYCCISNLRNVTKITPASALAVTSGVLAIWPAPRQMTNGSTTLRLASSFTIQTTFSSPSNDLTDAISQTQIFLKNDKLGPLTIDRGASLAGASKAPQLSRLVLRLNPGKVSTTISSEVLKDVTARDESYTLSVPADGSTATIAANNSLGLFRGLTTFGQLWYSSGGVTFLTNAPLSITDASAFVSSSVSVLIAKLTLK